MQWPQKAHGAEVAICVYVTWLCQDQRHVAQVSVCLASLTSQPSAQSVPLLCQPQRRPSKPATEAAPLQGAPRPGWLAVTETHNHLLLTPAELPDWAKRREMWLTVKSLGSISSTEKGAGVSLILLTPGL